MFGWFKKQKDEKPQAPQAPEVIGLRLGGAFELDDHYVNGYDID